MSHFPIINRKTNTDKAVVIYPVQKLPLNFQDVTLATEQAQKDFQGIICLHILLIVRLYTIYKPIHHISHFPPQKQNTLKVPQGNRKPIIHVTKPPNAHIRHNKSQRYIIFAVNSLTHPPFSNNC